MKKFPRFHTNSLSPFFVHSQALCLFWFRHQHLSSPTTVFELITLTQFLQKEIKLAHLKRREPKIT